MGTHKHYGQIAPADVPGALLAAKIHNPGTQTNYSTSSTTAVPIDTTNMAVTFTAPRSGRVLVHLGALLTQTATGKAVYWHILDGANVVLATRWMYSYALAGGNSDFPGFIAVEISSVTPGASTTFRWGYSTTTGGTAYTFAGGGAGQAVMEVLTA